VANTFTFRHGQRRPLNLPVLSASVIEINDMLFLATTTVKAAADFTWNTDLATTQAGFADVFVGIAMHKSASGDTANVDVDVSPDSLYEYACNSATYAPGATLGPDKAAGNALLSQTLEAAVAASSVAKAMQNYSSATTSLLVSFASVYNPGANTAAGVTG
jgi:hypothetical protein